MDWIVAMENEIARLERSSQECVREQAEVLRAMLERYKAHWGVRPDAPPVGKNPTTQLEDAATTL